MADLKYHISPDNILFVLSFLFVNFFIFFFLTLMIFRYRFLKNKQNDNGTDFAIRGILRFNAVNQECWITDQVFHENVN